MTFEEQQELKVLSLLHGRQKRMLMGELEDALNEENGGWIMGSLK